MCTLKRRSTLSKTGSDSDYGIGLAHRSKAHLSHKSNMEENWYKDIYLFDHMMIPFTNRLTNPLSIKLSSILLFLCHFTSLHKSSLHISSSFTPFSLFCHLSSPMFLVLSLSHLPPLSDREPNSTSPPEPKVTVLPGNKHSFSASPAHAVATTLSHLIEH